MITGVAPTQPVRNPLRAAGANEVIAWLQQVSMADTGVLSGENARDVLLAKLDTDDLIESRQSPLPAASADTKWFVFLTDENRLYLKTYDGSTYGYTPAFSVGDYQLRVIYHTASGGDAPPHGISWNARNQTFNITSGGWSLVQAGAQWMRIVILPATSDTASVSPGIRVGDPPADAIAYSRPNSTGLFPAAVNNVDEALDYVHDNVTRGGGGTPAPAASDALIQTEEWGDQNLRLDRAGTTITQTFQLDEALRSFQTDFDGRIFAEAIATVETEASAAADPATVRVRFDLQTTASGAFTPAITQEVTFASSDTPVKRNIRVVGILPAGTTQARWRVTVVTNPVITHDRGGNPIPPAFLGVTGARLELRAVVNTDEVVILPMDRGANISNDVFTQSDLNQEVDALPVEVSDETDFAWPGGSNGIDDNGEWVTREFPIARLLGIRNARASQTFIAKLRYRSNYISGSRNPPANPPPDTVNFSHRVWSNLPDGLTQSALDARGYLSNQSFTGQTVARATRGVEVTLPSDCTALTVGFKSDTGQADARLLITDYTLDIEKGIDSSGFDGNLTTNVRSVQSLAQELDDLDISGAGGQAASFSTVNIWVAGGSVTDRLTNSSTQTLIAGNHWADFDMFQFEFDNGPQAGNLLPLTVTADAFRASSGHGTQTYTDLLGYLVRPVAGSTNQFVFVWGNQGLRRIVGINTA